MTDPKLFFSEQGPMALNRSDYEIRPQQIRMARAVEDAIHSSRNLVVEAGTGVGKSLAYLVPFISWSVSTGKRVVISTYTKALQNQLLIKDLPFLRDILDVPFRYSICMGSDNYICLRKFHKNSRKEFFTSVKQAGQAEKIKEWLAVTETGLVTDMDLVPDRNVWNFFCREGDMCTGRKCPEESSCFYRKAKLRQASSHILITNHSLLFTDMMSDARVLPEFHALVLDEAHTVEDVATGHFGKELSRGGVKYLTDEISAFLGGKNAGKESFKGFESEKDAVREMNRALVRASGVFFTNLGRQIGVDEGTFEYDTDICLDGDISFSLVGLAESLSEMARKIKDPEAEDTARAFCRRCSCMAEASDFVFDKGDDSYVYWVDVRKTRRSVNYLFHAAPIDISGLMRERFFEKVAPVVLTSATLSCSGGDGGFDFIKKRLGLDNPMEMALDSPYDYKKNVMVYLDRKTGDPARDPGGYSEAVCSRIVDIYDIMGGRMFALFTSYDMMDRVAASIADRRPDIKLLKQGDLPRYVLLDVFKNNKDSILLGTATFWQGVDVPGDSLECVIIAKLPFAVPTDPVNAARIRYYRDMGMNPFMQYQLPRALIMFRQGIGRLIRNSTDRGVIAILDPRVSSRRYGPEFLKPLKECRKTFEIEDLRTFFRQ